MMKPRIERWREERDAFLGMLERGVTGESAGKQKKARL